MCVPSGEADKKKKCSQKLKCASGYEGAKARWRQKQGKSLPRQTCSTAVGCPPNGYRHRHEKGEGRYPESLYPVESEANAHGEDTQDDNRHDEH